MSAQFKIHRKGDIENAASFTEDDLPAGSCAAAYLHHDARDHTEQLGSCNNQVDVFMAQINENPEWELVEIYADPEMTGTTSDRPEFKRMMEDAEKHEFDVLLCKSISRFARNTLISVQSVRRLQALGITVIFEKENIDTSNKASEVMLTIMSAFAQEESRNISERVKAGLKLHYQNGEALWSELYGYRKVKDQEYVIEGNEAAVVRRIFNAFEKGSTVRDIVASLNSDGIPSPDEEALVSESDLERPEKRTLCRGCADEQVLHQGPHQPPAGKESGQRGAVPSG